MDEPTHESPRTKAIVVARHSAVTRLTHWINVVAMMVMLMSGLQILNAHPALYWGESGFSRPQSWFHVTTQGSATAFPGWITVPSYRDLATGRRWHFFFAWVLVVNGLVYLIRRAAHAAFVEGPHSTLGGAASVAIGNRTVASPEIAVSTGRSRAPLQFFAK